LCGGIDVTDIFERLKEAQTLYESAGVNGEYGSGLMVDAQARIAELEAALRPFARHVDKSSCEITMVWRDGDYVSTYTDTLKSSDFWAATTALKAKP
jgi:hypothetical protein